MTDKVFDNNQVSVAGEVISDFEYSHQVFGEGFYLLQVRVGRLSDSYDVIPLMISERLIDVKEDYKGKYIEVLGQFRSYNRHEDNRNRLVLSVFVREIRVLDEIAATEESGEGSFESHGEMLQIAGENCKPNFIYLDGYICKPPIYRRTPLGREIADLLLAVNRPYGKSDYIPCICWGRNARFAEKFNVGEHVQLWGRIQSREYQKKISETEVEKRVAYEVSVSKLECEPEA